MEDAQSWLVLNKKIIQKLKNKRGEGMSFEFYKTEEDYVSKEEISPEAQEKLLKRAKNQKRGARLFRIATWFNEVA